MGSAWSRPSGSQGSLLGTLGPLLSELTFLVLGYFAISFQAKPKGLILETPVSKLGPGWHLSGYKRALSEGLRHKSCPAPRARPLNLEASPPSEVKLQVPCGGQWLWPAVSRTDLVGWAPAPCSHTSGEEARGQSPECQGAAGCARGPFSWPVLPGPTCCIQRVLAGLPGSEGHM